MASTENEDNDVILSKAIQEIEHANNFMNKGQALYERGNDFLEAANFRFKLLCYLYV